MNIYKGTKLSLPLLVAQFKSMKRGDSFMVRSNGDRVTASITARVLGLARAVKFSVTTSKNGDGTFLVTATKPEKLIQELK